MPGWICISTPVGVAVVVVLSGFVFIIEWALLSMEGIRSISLSHGEVEDEGHEEEEEGAVAGKNTSQDFLLRASNPHPFQPSRRSMSTRTPFPQPMSTKPTHGLRCRCCCHWLGSSQSSLCPSCLCLRSPMSYTSCHHSIRNAAIRRSSKTCFLGSVRSTHPSMSRFACVCFRWRYLSCRADLEMSWSWCTRLV